MNGHPASPPPPGAPLGSGARAPAIPTAERVRVSLAWLVVLVPAMWGVAQVVEKSAALFR